MSHDNRHLGLQQHSIGELYPWSIVIKEKIGRYVFTPTNLITGKTLPSSYCQVCTADSGVDGFIDAHDRAENTVRRWIAACDEYHNAMSEESDHDDSAAEGFNHVGDAEELGKLGYPDCDKVLSNRAAYRILFRSTLEQLRDDSTLPEDEKKLLMKEVDGELSFYRYR